LQQHDNEGSVAYKIRRANGMSRLQLMEQALRDGERLTVGLDAAEDGRTVAIEVLLDAKPNSEFADFLQAIGGRQTKFQPILQEHQPLSFSLSWMLDERQKEAATGILEAMRDDLIEHGGVEHEPVWTRYFGPFLSTVEEGHLDACLQVNAVADDEFVIIGAMDLLGGESWGLALREMLQIASQRPDVRADIELDAFAYQNAIMHRITPDISLVDENATRMLGGVPDIYLGSSSRTAWIGIGRDGLLPQLEITMDILAEGPTQIVGQTSTPPIQAIIRTNQWLNLSRNSEKKRGRLLIAEDAFEEDDDALHIELRPTNTGLRLRLKFEEGFVRFVAMFIASQFDKTQL
jgi:hypothetical protein